jgi:hypothetical protein
MPKLLWTQRQDIGPAGRTGSAMAFDSVRGKMVLFGGATADRGTWEWDGQYWTQVSDMGPALRRDFGMAWDSASQCVLLFGGAAVSVDAAAIPGANPAMLADTWAWDGESWTQVDDAGPSSRFAFGLASDTTRNRVVLFGGANFVVGGPQALGDTWEWDGAAWTQQDETGPLARSGHKMTFDSTRARTVLFGGVPIDGSGQSDTWEWSGTAWVRVSEFGPAPRFAAGLCFDGSQSILFGGRDFGSSIFGDTWSWDGRFWTQRQDIGPQPRNDHAMAFDTARKRSVLFGGSGLDVAALNDTWELVAQSTPPPPA